MMFLPAFIAVGAIAQIPNNGFESWTSMGAYENPDSWGTLNNTTAAASIYTATKAAPGSPGSYYMKLTSKTIGPSVVNGIAVCGKLDSITRMPKSGFAYSGQPENFTGKWQHMIYGTSQGGITVLLTKWNTSLNKRDTVAIANQTLSGMAMSWANFTIPFNYFSTDVPDSCIIFLRASGANPTNNDYLWVDNLGFSGSVAGIENNSIVSSFSVYPNPAVNSIHTAFELAETDWAELSLTDITGKIIFEKYLENPAGLINETISCENLAKGTYFMRLKTGNGSAVKQIIIE